MMVMTAKVDLKKILLILAAVAALILAAVLLMGDSSTDTAQTTAVTLSGNDRRVQFLKDFGWDVTNSPEETSQVKIPEETTEVFDRYNNLQKSQGYDLSSYAGKSVMRYVYRINNYPGATEPVYATILVHKDTIIGGDVTDTAAHGKIHGFQRKDTGETTPAATGAAASPAEATEELSVS